MVSGVRELVGRVVDEPALAGEGVLEPLQHRVDGARDLRDLVVRAGIADASSEVASRDQGRTVGDALERPQRASGCQPRE